MKTTIRKPSVLEQLEAISNQFRELEYYYMDVSGDDPTDAIFCSRMQDEIKKQIDEIKSRTYETEAGN